MRLRTSSELANRLLADQRAQRPQDPLKRAYVDKHGDCTDPMVVEVEAAPDPVAVGLALGRKRNHRKVIADMYVRCRRCEMCLRHRRRLWVARATAEVALSARSWFGTITLSPEAHHAMLARARTRLHKQAVDFDALEVSEQFQHRHREITVELQKYFKRVRKHSSARLRYLIICEAHKSGLPHYHCLVHEVGEKPVTYRDLVGDPQRQSQRWPWGFVNFKLIDTGNFKPAYYVCKYLAKSVMAKPLASARYGRDPGATPRREVEAETQSVQNPQTSLERGNSNERIKIHF